MSRMPFPPKEKNDVDKTPGERQESILTSEHEINITEGSEFLDDRIRMKDQPFCETTPMEDQ
jgi:hypothetical protein